MQNHDESSVKPAQKSGKVLFRSLVGRSQPMQKVRSDIEKVANTDANVLITGESGTGKEVVARNVHYHSARCNKPFVPVNCGAIPHDLLESELFGHEKGAFTGAITTHQGRFAMAEGGTLFLDEIGEMTMAMQVKLLRVLEERVYERVGGHTEFQADVRIIAATNRNLEEMVADGKFREDLYFRLDVFPVRLPALRNRIEDLPLLAKELISRLEQTKRCSVRLTQEAIQQMSRYDWPGNVRELANMIERMAIVHPNGLVEASDLPDRITVNCRDDNPGLDMGEIDIIMQQEDKRSSTCKHIPEVNFPMEGFNLKQYISEIEIGIIQTALDNSDGVIAHAAKSLGLRRTTLAEKMRKYQIERPSSSSHMSAA